MTKKLYFLLIIFIYCNVAFSADCDKTTLSINPNPNPEGKFFLTYSTPVDNVDYVVYKGNVEVHRESVGWASTQTTKVDEADESLFTVFIEKDCTIPISGTQNNPPSETGNTQPTENSDNCDPLEESKIGIRNRLFGTFIDVQTDQINATYVIQLSSGDQFLKEIDNSATTFTQKVSTSDLSLSLNEVKVFRVIDNCTIPGNNGNTTPGNPAPGGEESECIVENLNLSLPMATNSQKWREVLIENLTNDLSYQITFKPSVSQFNNQEFGVYSKNEVNGKYFKEKVTLNGNDEQTIRFSAEAAYDPFFFYLKKNDDNDASVDVLCLEEAAGYGDQVFWDIADNIPEKITNNNYQFGTNLNFITPVNTEKDLWAQGIRPFKTPDELAVAFSQISADDIMGTEQSGCQIKDNPDEFLNAPKVVYQGTPQDIDFTKLKSHHALLQNHATGIWRTEYFNQIRDNYSINRYMIWAGTNSSFESDWISRVKQYDCGQNTSYRLSTPLKLQGEQYAVNPTRNFGKAVKPMAYEWMIDLSNKTDNGMWINVPHEVFEAFDHENPNEVNEYAIKLAILIKHGLDMEGVVLRDEYKNNYAGLANATTGELQNIGGKPVCQPLENNLEIYVEYSNEIWNYAGEHFKQTYYGHEEATKMMDAAMPEFEVVIQPNPDNPRPQPDQFSRNNYRSNVSSDYYYYKFNGTLITNNDLIAKYSAYGHILTWQAFKYVFGNSDRVKFVLGHWHNKHLEKNSTRNDDNLYGGTIWTMDQLKVKYDIINSLEINPDQLRPDFIAIAPYFAAGSEWSGNINSRPNYWKDLARHVDALTDQVKEIRKVLESHNDIFHQDAPGSQSAQLISYEGGQHIIRDCKEANSKLKSPGVCDDMYDIYSLYLSKLREDMPSFVHFTHAGAAPLDIEVTSSTFNGALEYKGIDCWGATELVAYAENTGNNPGGYKVERAYDSEPNNPNNIVQKVDVVVTQPFGNSKLKAIQDHIGNPNNYGSCIGQLKQLYQSGSLDNMKDLVVQPNPFTNNLTLKTEKENGLMRIVDMTGRILLQQEVESKTTTINTKILKPGYYLIEVENAGKTQTQKVIKY